MPDYGLLGGAEQMAFFFATAVDLLEVLVRVEVKLGGRIYAMWLRPRAESGSLLTANDLPTLFDPQPAESALAGPAYLIREAGSEVALRQLPQYEGKDRWSVDQLANPDSTPFWKLSRIQLNCP